VEGHPRGLQRRGAVAVHGRAGQEVVPEQRGDGAADVVALLAGGLGAAHDQVTDVVRVELGHLVQGGPHDGGGEVVWPELRQ
jgi:hypothetical protein